jgi:hypothetical protein
MAEARKLENPPTGRQDVAVSHGEKLITELRNDRGLTTAYPRLMCKNEGVESRR